MNYSSKTNKYTALKNFKTKLKKTFANILFFYGWNVKQIASLLKLSESRIYQYLKK